VSFFLLAYCICTKNQSHDVFRTKWCAELKDTEVAAPLIFAKTELKTSTRDLQIPSRRLHNMRLRVTLLSSHTAKSTLYLPTLRRGSSYKNK
jgi:hypothetical protein